MAACDNRVHDKKPDFGCNVFVSFLVLTSGQVKGLKKDGVAMEPNTAQRF